MMLGLSRNQLIALGASLAVVVIAFWLVTALFPGPPEPVLGKWRSKDSPRCDGQAVILVVTPTEIDLQDRGKPPTKIMGITAIESDGDAHRLRIFFPEKAPDYDLYAPYEVEHDTLTFGTLDWTPQAKRKYAGFTRSVDEVMAGSTPSFAGTLALHQPFRRCPPE
jgi:hypothetical protein